MQPPAQIDAADGRCDGRTPRLRFPKAARLILTAEFARVRTEGRNVHGRLMLLGVLKMDMPGRARVGIITSKKVGGAVIRNRVRRRLREIVRLARPSLISDVWLVIVAKSGAAKASYDAIRDEWAFLAKKARILIQ